MAHIHFSKKLSNFKALRITGNSSANRNILTVSLPICITFIYFSCLIVLARNSSTILNRSGDSGYPCLIPDFRGNGFSFSPASMVLAVDLCVHVQTVKKE
jgi:hypothetical protein